MASKKSITLLSISSAHDERLRSELVINFGLLNSQFGECFIAWSNEGILSIDFIEQPFLETVLNNLKRDWPFATFIQNTTKAKNIANNLFSPQTKNLNAVVNATPFQIKVWQALLNIPFGEVTTYSNIAKTINNENAVRAVGTAIGKNPLAYLIPCHRVIRNNGELGGYRWGLDRKQAMLNYEQLAITKPAMLA